MMNKTVNEGTTQKTRKVDMVKVANIAAIVLSVLLLPILFMNCVLIIKGIANPNEVPSIGNKAPLIVLTESMEPEIKAGDLIICRKADASEVKKDDVISFFDPEGNGSSVVTHRVIALVEENGELVGFRTQGDNNDIEDRLTVPVENVIGIWTEQRIGLVGHVVLFMQSTVGLIVCLFLPIGAFVAYVMLRRRKQDKEKQDDIAALKAELEALKEQRELASETETKPQTEEIPE
jgi:signal peptidase